MFAEGAFAQPKLHLSSSSSSYSSSPSWKATSSRSSNHRRAKLCPTAALEQTAFSSNACSGAASHVPFQATIRSDVRQIISDFNGHEPIERASTPPSSCLGSMQYIVCRDGQGELHGFHNVCRHHASPIATGFGCKRIFQCPYHGWSYSLDGRFQKATQLTGIQNFKAKDNGLLPISVASWGPFVLLNFSGPSAGQKVDFESVSKEWLRDASPVLEAAIIDAPLCHVAKREYLVKCNWKVFCDNYLDGGYHVPIAHKNLASGLSLASYSTQVLERVSIQSCKTEAASDRLGQSALYAFVYPNFMINRYGPWMDTNLVIPVEASKCLVIFDYFLDPQLVDDKEFIRQSLLESETVQLEDTVLCEGVQKGLESPAFSKGRYAPAVEMAMYHFHRLLQQDLLLTL